MTLAQTLEAALPIVAALITSLLQQDKWPNWVNALICLAVLVASGLLTAYLGNALTGRPDADIGIIVTATLALQGVPYFQPYFDFIRNNILVVSPTAKEPPLPPVPPTLALVPPPVEPAPVPPQKGGKAAVIPTDPTPPAAG